MVVLDNLWPRIICGAFFGLPSGASKPGLLQETGVTLIRGKAIRIAMALLATAGSEGSDRK